MNQPAHAHYAVERLTVPASYLTRNSGAYRMSLQPLIDQTLGEARHLVALVFAGTVKVTVGSAVNGQAGYATHIHRALRGIRLVVAEFEHTVDVDGEDLLIDEAIRCGLFRPNSGRNTYASLATGTMSIPFEAALRLDNPRASDEMRHDATIPVKLFEDSAKSYLEFQVASDLGMGTDVQMHDDGFTALTVYAVTTPRNDVVRPTPWRLRSFSDVNLSHAVDTRGALSYLVNVNRSTTLAQVDHSGTTFDRLAVGGETVNTSLTQTTYSVLESVTRPTVADGSLLEVGWKPSPSTSAHSWTGVPLIMPAPDTRATKLTRGRVDVTLASMPSGYNSRIRYLYRETGVVTVEHEARILRGLGIDPARAVVEVKAAQGRGGPAAGILPGRVRSEQLRYPAAAARASK